jgi:hypothetical protein
MKSTLSLEKDWLEGLHNEYLPGKNSFPVEIRESIVFSSCRIANPLFPLLIKWTLEPAGIPQTDIVPLAYAVHLLEASSCIVNHLSSKDGKPHDKRFKKLLASQGDALCILCVDAMVTMSFQLLTELPQAEFMELSDLLIERFGSNGVLGKKADGQGDWKGDMIVVSFEASSKLAKFEPLVRRKLMDYAKKLAKYYRELEFILGEPPGREMLIDNGRVSSPRDSCDKENVHRLLGKLVETSKNLGLSCGDLFALSEGVVELFTGFERSFSRLKEKQEAATAEDSIS